MSFEKEFALLQTYAKELLNYYDVDKVKADAVYVWDKGESGENVFDIFPEGVYFYKNYHIIPESVRPTINKIQHQLVVLEKLDVNSD